MYGDEIEVWCETCTYDNPPWLRECAMCDTPLNRRPQPFETRTARSLDRSKGGCSSPSAVTTAANSEVEVSEVEVAPEPVSEVETAPAARARSLRKKLKQSIELRRRLDLGAELSADEMRKAEASSCLEEQLDALVAAHPELEHSKTQPSASPISLDNESTRSRDVNFHPLSSASRRLSSSACWQSSAKTLINVGRHTTTNRWATLATDGSDSDSEDEGKEEGLEDEIAAAMRKAVKVGTEEKGKAEQGTEKAETEKAEEAHRSDGKEVGHGDEGGRAIAMEASNVKTTDCEPTDREPTDRGPRKATSEALTDTASSSSAVSSDAASPTPDSAHASCFAQTGSGPEPIATFSAPIAFDGPHVQTGSSPSVHGVLHQSQCAREVAFAFQSVSSTTRCSWRLRRHAR